MLINFVDATIDANHYTKPPPSRMLRTDSLTAYATLHYAVASLGEGEGRTAPGDTMQGATPE